jgi:hypothetical protein
MTAHYSMITSGARPGALGGPAVQQRVLHARAKAWAWHPLVLLILVVAVPTARADEKERRRRPDVGFIPTPQEVVDQMLDLAGVTKSDVVADLGCGYGRFVVTAAKK